MLVSHVLVQVLAVRMFRLLCLYLLGFGIVFLHAACAGLLTVWALQFLAMAFDETYAWGAILWHLFLSYSFLFFYPGQRFWTVVVRDGRGRAHVIVGCPQRARDD